jgi:hypothetical protein
MGEARVAYSPTSPEDVERLQSMERQLDLERAGA